MAEMGLDFIMWLADCDFNLFSVYTYSPPAPPPPLQIANIYLVLTQGQEPS